MAGYGSAIASTGGAGGAPRAGAFARGALALLALALGLALPPATAARAAECGNEARRAEQGSAALPDCRAYELVTPATKGSGEPLGILTVNQDEREPVGVPGARSSLAGERFAWWSEYALPEEVLVRPYEPGTPGLHYLSTRSADGWSSENAIPPQSVEYGLACQQAVGIAGWSTELGRGVLADGIGQESTLSPGGTFIGEGLECGHDEPRLGTGLPEGFEEREGFQNIFLREPDGSHRLLNLTPLGAPLPRPSRAGQEYFPASYLAGSDDLSHVVFEEELPLTPEAEQISPEVAAACENDEPGCWEGHDNLYEWTDDALGGPGAVRLVTILPDGSPVEGRLAGATRNNGRGGIGTEKVDPTMLAPNVAAFRHAVSADGSRIFFEAAGGLYVREDGTRTVRIDTAQSGLPTASDGGGAFMAASADGTNVYFTADASHLLTSDTVPGSGANLYRCQLPREEVGPCELVNLTPAPEAGVLGVSGTNEGTAEEEESGSPYVYFVATGVLGGDPGPLPGQPNLYLRHGGVTEFIATLAGAEEGEAGGTFCTKSISQGSCQITYGDSCDWTARGGCEFIYEKGELINAFGGLTSRVSEDGRFLAFNSIRPLTGYDNEDPGSELPGETLHPQVFVYDAAAGELKCASCNPDPAVRPTAPALIRAPATPAGNSYQHAVYPQRQLTEDGRLFFESYDALLPEDTGGALSVYEYDTGSGGLALISSGASEVESIFLDASADGSDVFFMTAERLLGADRDTAFDVYDARVEGGFPEAAEPPPPCDSESACRLPATPAPAVPVPGSASFVGPGNVREAPAARRHKKRKHHKGRHRKQRRGGQSSRAWSSSRQSEGRLPGQETVAAQSAAGEETVEAGTAPIAVTEPARDVGETTAELRGKVYHEVLFNSPECLLLGIVCHNSAGTRITGCTFEFASAAYFDSHGGTYGRQATCEPPPPYEETEQIKLVGAAVAELEANTTYHYRLVARNEGGETGTGADMTFTTLGTHGPPSIEREAYEVARQTDGTFTATLNARINPHGYETSCAAQLVAEAEFQESGFAEATELGCAPQTLPVGFGAEEATATASGLEPGTRYRFRFLAENEVGQDVGEGRTLLTFAIESFEVVPGDLQAGGHPDQLSERFRLSTAPENPWGAAFPSFAVVNAKSIVTTLPPGLIGNPLATPRCEQHELAHATCGGAAQVGILRVEGNRQQAPAAFHELPLYNLVPPPGVAAQLGAPLPSPINASAHVNAGLDAASSYGVEAAALNTTAAEGLISVDATIWGVPHDPSHDDERFCPAPGGRETTASRGGECEALEGDPKPFLRNPTSCSSAPVARLKVDAWQGPGDFAEASSEMPPMEGCDEVPFEPVFELAPTATSADSPTGLRVNLHLPQPQSPTETGTADLRKAVIALPEGLEVNPASADGLAACGPAQIDLEGEGPARCPDASKIGTVEVSTPLLERALRGGAYVAEPYENPFGSLLALYIAVDDPHTGIVVKLAGEVEADPATGQLTTTFDQSPQLPFEDLAVDFFGGPRAALKTPATCGTFASDAVFTPWTAPEGEEATRSSSFEIGNGPGGSPCAATPEQAPYAPAFTAGTLEPRAGTYSPFVMRLTRGAGSQEVEGVSTTLPPGLTGRLAGIPYCPERDIARAATRDGRAEAADPACPAASRLGTVTVAAGAGPNPHHVSGSVYLAGPHQGAPLSLAVVTPAVAGPFDLGTVVVRALLHVDPETARIHAVAGPIPSMLQGIPLDVRSIALQLDRPGFTLNPTSCEPMAIAGTALSTLGQPANLSARFQVGGCEALSFAPRLRLSLKGGTRRSAHPALKAVLTAGPGEANIAGAQVTLPRSQFLDQGHLQEICTRVQFNAGGGNGEQCPPSSIYGFARAETPLLDQPLEGPVFLRSSSHELPDLVAALGGQIDIVLAGRVDSVKGRIRNSFEVVPDAPVTKFTLEMRGGARGLLVNSTNICASVRSRRARVLFFGQNGRVQRTEPVIKASCKKKRKGRQGLRRR
ncbi:MAG TPA: hypothetical protein VFM51_09345 [Solirubrobacterales bacterium]|nr:hypothetical protein [Solirubrobacterales bacterium]